MPLPETLDRLDILWGGARVAHVLAVWCGAALRKAGLGSACHGFRAPLPTGGAAPLQIRRAADAAAPPWTPVALAA